MNIEAYNLDSLRKIVRRLFSENRRLKQQLKDANIPFESEDPFSESIEQTGEYDPDQGARINNPYITENMVRQFFAMFWGRQDVYENARLFADAGVRCVIITRGKKGCLMFKDGEYTEIPAYPSEKTVDTTGAGDSFAAGFLYALSKGLSVKECAMFGNAAASCVVEGPGASYGIRSLENVIERFDSII